MILCSRGWMKQLNELDNEDKPRERLLRHGAKTLKNRELIALILGSGSQRNPLFTIAKKVDELLEKERLDALGIEKLSAIPGVGTSKASQLLASFELARRFYEKPERKQILSPEDALFFLHQYEDKNQEHFFTLTLDGSKQLIAAHLVFIGTLNRSIFHPREVFTLACSDHADTIIIAHNHPSGQNEPSREDRLVTQRVLEAGKLMGIELLDHLIFSRNGYYSFAANGFFC